MQEDPVRGSGGDGMLEVGSMLDGKYKILNEKNAIEISNLFVNSLCNNLINGVTNPFFFNISIN